jgi:SNF2 family DNA or RNA helicase
MHWVAPDEWPSRTKFRDRYCITRIPWYGGFEVLGLEPTTEEEMRRILMPRFIRRTKAEVLPDIPEPLPTGYRQVTLSPEQARIYRTLASEGMAQVEGGLLLATETLHVHKLCDYAAVGVPVVEDGKVVALTGPSSKAEALWEIMDELAGDPAVVYSPSRKVVDFLAAEAERKKFRVGKITGSVQPEARHAYVNQFQKGELDIIFLTSAGAEGITLTRAHTLIFIQQDWSEIVNKQVGDRIHRPGQEKAVRRIVLMAQGTIDEGRRWALEQKGERQEEVLRDKDRLIHGRPTDS